MFPRHVPTSGTQPLVRHNFLGLICSWVAVLPSSSARPTDRRTGRPTFSQNPKAVIISLRNLLQAALPAPALPEVSFISGGSIDRERESSLDQRTSYKTSLCPAAKSLSRCWSGRSSLDVRYTMAKESQQASPCSSSILLLYEDD